MSSDRWNGKKEEILRQLAEQPNLLQNLIKSIRAGEPFSGFGSCESLLDEDGEIFGTVSQEIKIRILDK